MYDHNIFTSNDFIGKFTVDAAYIYQLNSDHELYRKWVVLTDTTDVTEGVRGYLRVTINVLGPGDRPPVHDERKDLKIKDDAGENHIFSPGHIDKTWYLMKFNLYRAEHLPPLDLYNNKLDPYLSIAFAGVNIKSNYISDNRNPEFNECLHVPFTMPWLNRKIKWEMWDADPGVDERVGTFIVSFPDKEADLTRKDPMWANMYGPLYGVKGEKADYMTKFSDAGTHYRGRVLYSLDFKQQKDPKAEIIKLNYSMPDNPPPNPKERIYILRADLYNGFELPEKLRSACIHVTWGPYKAMSPVSDVSEGCATWNYQFDDLKISAPVDILQVFDVIIYLAKSAKAQDRI